MPPLSTPAAPVASGVRSFSLALAGSGGAGVMTAGTLLLDAAARAGLYGLFVRTSGPQIRGGEAAALLRIGPQPLATLDDRFDLLLAIDWMNLNRFADEIPLSGDSLLVGDLDEGDAPEVLRASGARCVALPLKKTAKAAGGWVNMVALGYAGTLAGVPAEAMEAALRASWKRTAERTVSAASAPSAGREPGWVTVSAAMPAVRPTTPSAMAKHRPVIAMRSWSIRWWSRRWRSASR